MSQVQTTAVALLRKLDELESRYEQLRSEMNDPAVHSNSARLISISKESGQLEPVVTRYRDYKKARDGAAELSELSKSADKEMAELATLELSDAELKADAMLEALKDEFLAAEDNAV